MTKTNLGLVEHCEKALKEKWFYGWGTYGEKATENVIQRVLRAYPSIVSPRLKYMRQALNKNTKFADCYGMVKSYLWDIGDGKDPKVGANGYPERNTNGVKAYATEIGLINTMPEISGLILWMNGHVGVYIGNGEFIECADNQGVVKGKLENGKIVKGSRFTHWIKDSLITYVEPEKEEIVIPNIIEIEEEKPVKIEVEMKNEIMLINNKEVNINTMLINDLNYPQLRDFCKALETDNIRIDVGYDYIAKLPTIDIFENINK